MSRVHHAVELPAAEQFFHLPLVQPLGRDLHAGDLQQLPAVLRSRAGQNFRLSRQPLHQLPPVRRSGEYAELIHPGSLWASPDSRR